ncbi:DUF2235 domain-containing protein [Klebsiella michiganensis]|uniref:DUF2235 domain-containing protein n=1 Tax=Klebsiella michiganensis TaxID=1134687 RepID=UPI002253EFBA|nr:DUF2235 domain-containing protein [Klebsiella michiganensis]MCX3080278.1 DUF2235 domain-containing protein [Klebsiella michiganensis]MCY0820167.1 DUF2235 domain-containing protein [Klebsiella michiganensis]
MNILVFCDGTWNTPQQLEEGKPAPTNVVKLRNAAEESKQQRVYYHPGVGTEGGIVNHYLGGGIGEGLDKNIISAYFWLARNYRPGDKIWLFGFSRGAYTVRSLGGMISRCGLLDASASAAGDEKVWRDINELFQNYRKPLADADIIKATARRPFYDVAPGMPTAKSIEIHFIGVWDTVGALGIPDDMALANLLDNPEDYVFHDTSLSSIVQNARHALALDEQRQSFIPTLWDNVQGNPHVKQCWFAGVHADVGGGYAQSGLSDVALQWMLDEAKPLGLLVKKGIDEQLAADPLAILHDSVTGFFKLQHTRPRGIPQITADNQEIHPSVLTRQKIPSLLNGDYRRSQQVTKDAPVTIDIFSRERWNQTGVWLEGGKKYLFQAVGQWLDSSIPSGPAGTDDGKFYPGEAVQVLASLSDKLESLWRGVSKNQNVDFWLSRRIGSAPWFALIGMVANNVSSHSVDPYPLHQVFTIGDGCSFTPEKSGYFYAYANDAWQMYDNNRGSVSLTITMS